MATNGKWEARITVPTGGWSFTVTETGGGGASDAVTVAAGTYYHSTAGSGANDLAASVAALLNAATLNATYTCTVAAGENGTGKYTITASGGSVTSIAFTWTDTEIRDLMGFDGSESDGGGLSATSANQAQGIWFPSCPPMVLNGYDSAWAGWWVSDGQEVKNAYGSVYGALGQSHRENSVTYAAITRAKTWAVDETTTNESFETFLREGIHGTASWGTVTGPLRWHPDAADDATYLTYSAMGMLQQWRPEPTQTHYVGNWQITFPLLVEVPS